MAFRILAARIRAQTRFIAVLALVVTLVGIPNGAAAAGTVYVDGNVGTNSPTCGGSQVSALVARSRSESTTRRLAIPSASLRALSGTSPRTAALDGRLLALVRAQTAVDASTRGGAQSVGANPQGTSVSAASCSMTSRARTVWWQRLRDTEYN